MKTTISTIIIYPNSRIPANWGQFGLPVPKYRESEIGKPENYFNKKPESPILYFYFIDPYYLIQSEVQIKQRSEIKKLIPFFLPSVLFWFLISECRSQKSLCLIFFNLISRFPLSALWNVEIETLIFFHPLSVNTFE